MSGAENRERKSWVLLHVGNRRFALPAESVVELAPPVRLHDFPHTSRLIAGVIVRRGRIVPVYDVAPVLCGRESSVHRFYLIAERAFGRVKRQAKPAQFPSMANVNLPRAKCSLLRQTLPPISQASSPSKAKILTCSICKSW